MFLKMPIFVYRTIFQQLLLRIAFVNDLCLLVIRKNLFCEYLFSWKPYLDLVKGVKNEINYNVFDTFDSCFLMVLILDGNMLRT